MKKENFWKILSIILIACIIILIGIIVYPKIMEKIESNKQPKQQTDQTEETSQIALREDISLNKEIKGVEGVKCHYLGVTQEEGKAKVTILIDNQTEEKIPTKQLSIKLLDEKGKEKFTKEVEMPEITDAYGYASIEFEMDNPKLVIFANIELEAI